jgi:hypothetical protein
MHYFHRFSMRMRTSGVCATGPPLGIPQGPILRKHNVCMRTGMQLVYTDHEL